MFWNWKELQQSADFLPRLLCIHSTAMLSPLCLQMVLLHSLVIVSNKTMLVQGAISVCCCPAAGRGRATAIAPAG